MDLDDLPKMQRDTLKALENEDLEPFSLEALRVRIKALEAEIERCKKAIEAKTGTRAVAEALFGGKK